MMLAIELSMGSLCFCSKVVRPRAPWGKDGVMDYEVESENE